MKHESTPPEKQVERAPRSDFRVVAHRTFAQTECGILARLFRCVVGRPGWSNEGETHDFLGENGCDFVDSAKQANQ